MENIKQNKFKQVAKRRRLRGARNRGYQQSLGHVYSINNGPIRAPMLPTEFSVQLTDRHTATAIAAGDINYVFGMLEFLNRVPTFASEFYTMYKYARVTYVEMEVTLVNHSTNSSPIDLIVGVVPASDGSTVSAAILEQKPGSIRRIVSDKGGMDRVTLRKSFNPAHWMGNPYQDKDFWVSSTQAISTTALDTREPVIVVLPASTAGVALNYYLNVRTKYHIQFFDLGTATNQ